MLAKQGWRLWENPDSLCVQVLKAEYFPNSTVLEAKPKAAMLYTWRSVLRDIELVKKGMIWRVGDGVGLKIWDDPWLPRDSRDAQALQGGRASYLMLMSSLIQCRVVGMSTW